MKLVVQYKQYLQSLECPKKTANPNILSTTTYLTFSNTNFYVLQTCITQSRERRGLMKSTKEFWSKKQFDKSSHYSDWLISRNHHSKGRNGVILTIYFHFVYILCTYVAIRQRKTQWIFFKKKKIGEVFLLKYFFRIQNQC